MRLQQAGAVNDVLRPSRKCTSTDSPRRGFYAFLDSRLVASQAFHAQLERHSEDRDVSPGVKCLKVTKWVSRGWVSGRR